MTKKQNLYLLLALVGFMAGSLALLFWLQTPDRGWLLLPLITSLPALVLTLEQLLVKRVEPSELIKEIELWLRLQRDQN